MNNVTKAVAAALRAAPASPSAIARAAKVPHTTVIRILKGHLGASPRVAKRIERVLRRWGDTCTRAADRVHRAVEQGK